MKKLYLAALLTAAIPLAACGGLGGGVASVASVCANTAADEKAWYGAEALYNVPAAAYRSTNERFKADPRWLPVKAVVKPKLQELNRYRLGAKSAYQACNLTALDQWVAAMKPLSAEVTALIPE